MKVKIILLKTFLHLTVKIQVRQGARAFSQGVYLNGTQLIKAQRNAVLRSIFAVKISGLRIQRFPRLNRGRA